jgi:hypothetical protein
MGARGTEKLVSMQENMGTTMYIRGLFRTAALMITPPIQTRMTDFDESEGDDEEDLDGEED